MEPKGEKMAAHATHPATSKADAHAGGHNAPYMLIWGILLVLTLAEVGYAFLSLPKFWLALGLIVMAVWKAILVALFYMHLRWEPKRLWVLAVSPLPLVAILILAVLMEY
jgi:cytochrome c oxidase subunit 4